MRNCKRQSALCGFLGEDVGLLAVHREGLFAHYGNSCLYGFQGGIKMDEVGGYNQNVVELFVVGQIFLVVNHVHVRRVSLYGIGPFCGLVHCNFRIRVQRPRHYAARSIRKNRLLVGLGYECAATAAYESYI